MIHALLSRANTRFIFVVGKGGVGKTTTASGLALALAEQGVDTHLISTDPAHSLGDYFQQDLSSGQPQKYRANEKLTLEEFSARNYADSFFANLRAPLTELIERGTYLDMRDSASFLDLSIPGIDEVMGALRLVDLHETNTARVVVDTAPTGHTIRLLDAAHIIDSWVQAGRAMAEKSSAVSVAMVGQAVPLAAETLLDEWQSAVHRFNDRVLRESSAIVVTRAGHVVEAETERLTYELEQRGLKVIDSLTVIPAGSANLLTDAHTRSPLELDVTEKLIWFAGKGGVGKSTCAAALATALAQGRSVCIVSTDPAGSLSEVFGVSVTAEGTVVAPNLVARQIDAPAEFNRMRDQYRSSVEEVFASLGLERAAHLDRRIIESLWDFAPPGIDEIISLIEIIESGPQFDTLVIDSAPTGHFLRLLAMPELALDWVHALMRLLLKYGAVASLDALAQDLLAFAKRLRQLKLDLSTPGTSAVFIVTLAEPMVLAETARLLGRLNDAGIRVAATILNRADADDSVAEGAHVMRAPDFGREVIGLADLRSFLAQWSVAR